MAKSKASTGRLRIIAGLWRGRKLGFPDRDGLRPTPDRVRETLFNWLQSVVPGSHCLDLFAGSGALGLEAASRGASRVLMLDRDQQAVSALLQNVKLLVDSAQGDQQLDVVADEAQVYLRNTAVTRPFDIVFIDPPYQLGLVPSCCQLLESFHWLADGARIYIEMDASETLTGLPEHWQCLKSKRAGQVGYYLFIRNSLQDR